MNPRQKSLLDTAHGNVVAVLETLHRRAARGTRAKPTVVELNNILDLLKQAKSKIEMAVAAEGIAK